MTDDEAAGLLEIAYIAMRCLPKKRLGSTAAGHASVLLCNEIARLRKRSSEDVQKEFEVGR